MTKAAQSSAQPERFSVRSGKETFIAWVIWFDTVLVYCIASDRDLREKSRWLYEHMEPPF